MLTKFWEETGKSLSGQWVAVLLRASLAFWAGGLLAWVYPQPDSWQALLDNWTNISLTARIATLIGALLIVLASSSVMEWLQRFLLKAMEGYWPRPFRWLRRWRTRRIAERLAKKEERWQQLDQLDLHHFRQEDRLEYVRLDREIVQLHPVQPKNLMPTALGNRLTAAEEYSRVRYGLEAIVVWPRLWSVLPESLREDTEETRKQLDSAVRLFGWGMLFCVWTVWAWWALPAGILVAVVAWLRSLDTAEVYGDLLRTAFDLHRFKLYEELRWPLPEETGEKERVYGERLTKYLFRGLLKEPIRFDHKKGDAAKKEQSPQQNE